MGLLNLLVRLGLDTSGYEVGLKRAQSKGAQFAQDFAATLRGQVAGVLGPTALAAGLEEFVRRTMDWTKHTKEVAEQMGVTTDEVQKLEVAMSRIGKSPEDFGAALNKLGAFREKAGIGDSRAQSIFAHYGVSYADIQNEQLRTYDLAVKIAGAIAGRELNAEERDNFRTMLGRNGPSMIAGLQKLNDIKFDPVRQEAIDRVAHLSHQLDEMLIRAKGVGAAGISGFIEGFPTTLAQYAVGGVGGAVGAGLSAIHRAINPYALGNIGAPSGVQQYPSAIGPTQEQGNPLYVNTELMKEQENLGRSLYEIGLKRLGLVDKEAALRAEINNLEIQASELEGSEDSADKITRLQLLKRIAEKGFDLDSYLSSRGQYSEQIDPLARIGGFSSSSDRQALLSLQQRVAIATEETAVNTRPEAVADGGIPMS